MARITIGMPVFNDIDFIKESLKSIVDQDFVDFKLIISDDGSTDGCEDICKELASYDKRVVYIRQPKNLGISKNMEFLLNQADTEYFMWAADDDLWSRNYITRHIKLLDANTVATSSFCDYYHIDEDGNKIGNPFSFDYSASSPYKRIKKFLKESDDGFGYGIFRTNMIKDVEFPVWWWPNRKTAYNNIFPSLCFYLAKGQYVHVNEVLFFKRVKTQERVNHVLSGEGNAIKETFSYIMRRFNLVLFSSKLILRANNLSFAIIIFPTLFYRWFLISSWNQIKLASRAFIVNRTKQSH